MSNETKVGDVGDTSYTKLCDHLYVGGMTSFVFLKEDGIKVHLWIQCSPSLAFKKFPVDFCDEYFDCSFDDSHESLFTPGAVEKIERAAGLAADRMADGLVVLISCVDGTNRGPLVACRTLQKYGLTDVIRLARRMRHEGVLSNKTFEGYVRLKGS
ncbi:MAG: hypothetical protein ABIJ46_05160 [bacterium]